MESTRTSPTPSSRTPSPSIMNIVMEQTYELIRYGTVVDTYNTGKGYAFVTFDNKEDASTVSVLIGCDSSSWCNISSKSMNDLTCRPLTNLMDKSFSDSR